MNYHRLALLLGVGALAGGVLGVVYPRLVAFDSSGVLVPVVGVLALLQALRVVRRRWRADLDEAATPDPELPVATPSPGEDIETALEQFLDARRVYYRRNRLRAGLRTAAVAVLSRYGSHSCAEAEAALDAGTWTDDRVAAAFLGGERAPSLPERGRFRNWFRRESRLERCVRHAVDAIAAAADLTPRSGDDATPSGEPHRGRSGGIRGGRSRSDPVGDGSRTGRSTVDGDDPDRETDGDSVSRVLHPTGRWRGVSAVALVGIGAGVLVGEPAVLLAGVVGIGFAAYARSSALPPGRVSVERSLGTERPETGEDVEVTVAVANETDRYLPDLRLVDGVPDALAVADGSPRLGTALRPGERATFTYTVTARRGVHAFGPALLVARDLPNVIEEERSLAAETTLTCIPSLRPLAEPVPLREQATRSVGQVETSSGGEGVEFHATRDYRPGDALSRIDWNRRARTGEFTTVEFREERAATVVLVIDAREAAYVSPAPYEPHAVDRAVDAAGRLFATLSDAGNGVGVAAMAPEECWLAPGAGVDHRLEARELLATHPALSPVPREGQTETVRWRRRLRKRLPSGTQIVYLTPLPDEYADRFARRFEEYGHPVTVISPDPTADRTSGHRLSRVARTLRVSGLRSAGIPVVDWPHGETLDAALARYDERWSR